MVTKSLVEVPFTVHGLIFIESVRGPLHLWCDDSSIETENQILKNRTVRL